MSGPISDKPQSIALTTGTVIRAVLVLLACAFLWFIRDLVTIVFVSILLAAIIDPVADWFSARHLPRGLAVITIYFFIAGLLALSIILLVPALSQEVTQVVGTLQSGSLIQYAGHLRDLSTQYGLQTNINSALASLQSGLESTFTSIFSTLRAAVVSTVTVFVVLVLAYYMVVEDEAARRSFRHVAPEEYQPYIVSLLSKIQKKVGSWMRGQLLIALIVGVVVYLGLLLLGVHYALLLALIIGACELIPYIGPVVSAVPAVVLAFGQSPFDAGCVLILLLVVQQLKNYLLWPKIMQKTTGLNPVVSIVALLVGVQVGGVVGAFLSVPIAIMLSVLLDDLLRRSDTKPV